VSLVGDIVQGLRELAPDPSQTLQPPTFTAVTNTSGALYFPAVPIYVKATQGTPWGETAASAEIALNAVGSVQCNVTATVATSFLATFVRVYFSLVAGGEDQYVEYDITTPTNSAIVQINTLSTVAQSLPPTISRAYLPDSDGNILSASLVYRWFNDGMKLLGQLTGGIKDITGIPSVQGVAQYPLVGQWRKIDNNFYDGYPVAAGTKQQVFRHSPVTGLSGVTVVNTSSDRQIIELWPQPQRTAGSGLTTSPALAADASINVNFGANGFVLGFGMILLGTYPPTALTGPNSCELIYYSTLGTTSISALTRGLGGTQAQAWPIGTPVYELNVYMTGLRMPQTYVKGQASFVFTCPPAFEDAIRTYLTHRFKLAEQDDSGAKSEFDRFKEICSQIKGMQQPNGPRQIQIGGTGGVEIASGLGSPFGGTILRSIIGLFALGATLWTLGFRFRMV
jgi:hypothetical protein